MDKNARRNRSPFQDWQRRERQLKWLNRAVWGVLGLLLMLVALGQVGQ